MVLGTEELRAFSAGVFNNRYALEVMAAVARPRSKPRFYVREIARELNLESNDVRPVVERLEVVGLIRRLAERGTHGAIYFTVEDEVDTFWRVILALCEQRFGSEDDSQRPESP